MPTSENRTCAHCGGPFTTTYGFRRGAPAKYCAKRCQREANNRAARARAAAKSGRELEPVGAPDPAPPPPSAAPVRAAPRPHDNGRTVRNARAAEGTRRKIDPTTCERDYTEDELEFMKAVQRYKKDANRPWPTVTELLQIAVSLGYRKVAPAEPLPGAK